jgi:hypothetical protein
MFFFVTLFFQNVEGWSALKTGVSWIALGVPFLLVAQSSGRLTKRFSPGAVIAVGCTLAAVGIAGLSFVTGTTSIAEVEGWYVGIAVGFGLLSPAASTVVMSSVEGGASGIASGILNTSRQIGTSVGLAVLGSVGVTVAAREWHADLVGAPTASLRQAGDGLVGSVTSGQVAVVRHDVGANLATWATNAFERGLQVALLAGAGLLLVTGLVAYVALRRPAPDDHIVVRRPTIGPAGAGGASPEGSLTGRQ